MAAMTLSFAAAFSAFARVLVLNGQPLALPRHAQSISTHHLLPQMIPRAGTVDLTNEQDLTAERAEIAEKNKKSLRPQRALR
jgi:hypothetical protein